MTPQSSIVFVIDDDASARRGLSRLLRVAGFCVETFSNAQKFLDREPFDGPGCIVLDLQMPGVDGLELQEELDRRGRGRPVVFVSGQADVPSAARALKRGAEDFLTKPIDGKDLVSAVRASIESDTVALKERSDLIDVSSRLELLSPREYEVMTHVITGRLNKQIAGELGITEETVKIHRGRVMHKLEVVSVVDLVRIAELANIAPADQGPS